MLPETISNAAISPELAADPALKQYLIDFKEGEDLFLEGDESQDLYILVAGQLEVRKGDLSISEIISAGSPFGEISFLLGSRRTASVRARTDGQAVRIPGDRIDQFLQEFPAVAWQIPRILAQRLERTSHILYGFKEFCDQVPDAVVVTDREGQLISWNKAAEELYGRTGEQMQRVPVEEIYDDPEGYRTFVAGIEAKCAPVRERILKVRHPRTSVRFISTSATPLFDGHHNFQGILSLGRDVTEAQFMQARYRRARYWLVPVFVFLVAITAGAVFLYPRLAKKDLILDVKQQGFRAQMTEDSLVLHSLLAKPFMTRDQEQARAVLRDFLTIQERSLAPYAGLLLLDVDKTVFAAYAPQSAGEGAEMAGSSYAGVTFRDCPQSRAKLLVVYRPDKQHPMGRQGVEMAFELRSRDEQPQGWVLFQLDQTRLEKELNLNKATLSEMCS